MGVGLVTPHNFGPRPREVAAVGGGQRRTPWAPAATAGAEAGEGSAGFENSQDAAEVVVLTPPPAGSPLRRRSQRAAAADANVQLQSEYVYI